MYDIDIRMHIKDAVQGVDIWYCVFVWFHERNQLIIKELIGKV